MIEVYGVPHFPTAGSYSASIILKGKPGVVCVEMHQEKLEELIRVMGKSVRTAEEEEYVSLAAGDGLVAIVEAGWEVGAEIYGLEPEKGYDIYESDYKMGFEGRF